jgi:hypothetical protein
MVLNPTSSPFEIATKIQNMLSNTKSLLLQLDRDLALIDYWFPFLLSAVKEASDVQLSKRPIRNSGPGPTTPSKV